VANTTPFDSPPLQGAWKKMPGRNPVIDNITTIQRLKHRIENLEEYIEVLHAALDTAGRAMGMSPEQLEPLRQSRELMIGEDTKRLWEESIKHSAHPNPLEKT